MYYPKPNLVGLGDEYICKYKKTLQTYTRCYYQKLDRIQKGYALTFMKNIANETCNFEILL